MRLLCLSLFTLLVGSAGCATAPARPTPPPPATAFAPAQRVEKAPVAEAPPARCPDSIRREEKLELGALDAPEAGNFLPGARMQLLERLEPAAARRSLTLLAGRVDVVAWGLGPDASVLLSRPEGDGHCVVNSWGTRLEPAVSVDIADTWRAKDGGQALVLVRLRLHSAAQGPVTETRWVVLATDGHRVWPALTNREGGMLQAIATEMAFQTRKNQLQLTVTNAHTQVLAFDPRRGHFVH